MQKGKRKVAAVSTAGGMVVGSSDVIRWNDTMMIQGYEVSVAKAVSLGLEKKIEIASKLEKDLKSKTGLLLTFPMAILMEKLQMLPEIGSGQKLLDLVKP